jgi:hypothetical protein
MFSIMYVDLSAGMPDQLEAGAAPRLRSLGNAGKSHSHWPGSLAGAVLLRLKPIKKSLCCKLWDRVALLTFSLGRQIAWHDQLAESSSARKLRSQAKQHVKHGGRLTWTWDEMLLLDKSGQGHETSDFMSTFNFFNRRSVFRQGKGRRGELHRIIPSYAGRLFPFFRLTYL